MTSRDDEATPGGEQPRPLSPRWWVQDPDGRVVVGQAPNPALYVYAAALLVQWTGLWSGGHDAVLDGIRAGALLVWGLDELVRGANPFRRLLGVLVLAAQIVGLLL